MLLQYAEDAPTTLRGMGHQPHDPGGAFSGVVKFHIEDFLSTETGIKKGITMANAAKPALTHWQLLTSAGAGSGRQVATWAPGGMGEGLPGHEPRPRSRKEIPG